MRHKNGTCLRQVMPGHVGKHRTNQPTWPPCLGHVCGQEKACQQIYIYRYIYISVADLVPVQLLSASLKLNC